MRGHGWSDKDMRGKRGRRGIGARYNTGVVYTVLQFKGFPHRTAADVLCHRQRIRQKFTNVYNILLANSKSQATSTTANLR